jgi:probable rRNA maturation factor
MTPSVASAPRRSLSFQNRQRLVRIDLRETRRWIKSLVEELEIQDCDLIFVFVNNTEMARINEQFLQHEGPTDVITFSYSQKPLAGEIVISAEVAREQAQEFATHWREELARYMAHGLLHLLGFDDKKAAPRRRMKREEDRCVKHLAERFNLRAKKPLSSS